MPKWLIWTLVVLLILVLVAGCGLGLYWFANECVTAYRISENYMPTGGSLELRYYDGGYTYFTWPESSYTDGYLLQFFVTEDDGSQRLIYAQRLLDNAYAIPDVPLDRALTIRIWGYKMYSFPFQDFKRIRYSENYLELTTDFAPPQIENLTWEADPETDQVVVRFEMDDLTTARMYYVDPEGQTTQIDTLTEPGVTLCFGDGEAYNVPGLDGSHTFAFDAFSQTDSYTYYGILTDWFTVVREDLLGRDIVLTCTDEGYNAYTLTWNETKGDYYEVQYYDDASGEWVTLHRVELDEERVYYTGHLERYSQYRFRVVALGGQTMENSEFAATGNEISVETGASLIYSTIWPIQDLEVYSDPEKTEIIGTAPAASAYCILDLENGMFRVRFEDGFGYIDSNYCMINLPEFIGGLCLYNITNSYESIYMVHEFEIPKVTGTVIKGYENVELAEDEYLVPLLYPTALKLETAAKAALEEGYQIKIYDSFRPHKATTNIYTEASKYVDTLIPDEIWVTEEERKALKRNGKEETLLWFNFLKEDLDIPDELIPPKGTYVSPSGTRETGTAEGSAETGEVTEPVEVTLEDYRPTYQELMLGNTSYSLANFLARSVSRHNYGIAMDMTLVQTSTGEELEMQSSMHDLSWYSELKQNNSNAKILTRIMTGNGFTGLTSEWWHFQDNDVYAELDLKYCESGITPECWMADDLGWRYRLSDGSYVTGGDREIGGVTYTFDENGYVLS